ncbi:MAG: DUF4384 domain-containing protein [Gemmatimonadota bacterium]|nr:MAG: DUF4384 domain-containing protein [Gemmatimonadota bacterium]
MLSVALLSLLVPAAGVDAGPPAAIAQQPNLPVQVWLNTRDVRLGDRVKVYTRVAADGYLLLLHAEPDGRIRVLFPIDPVEDNFVRGGSEFEIRGRGDREAFTVFTQSGVGTVYAAFSRDPFRFEDFARNNHWDYGLPDTWQVFNDAEADLTDIAATMASGAYFDYDMTQYGVGEVVAQTSSQALHFYGGTTYVGVADPYYRPWRHYAILSYPYNYYSWGWPSYGWGWGWNVGWGWGGWGFSVGFSWGWGGYWGYPYHYGYWGYPHHYGYWGYPYHYGYYSPCCYYAPYYPSPYYYGHSGYGYANDRRLRYTPQYTPSNAAGRSRRVYAASSAGLGSRRVASSSPASTRRGVTTDARRASPSSRTVDAAGRRASTAGRTINTADRRTSPTNRTINTTQRRTTSPVVRSGGTSTRSASTSSRRSFPQQPARTTPVQRRELDAPDRRAADVSSSALGSERQSTARRVTGGATTTRSGSQNRVSPVRRTTSSSSAQARPVRQTSSRSPVTSTRRTTTTSRPATTTARPRTVTPTRSQPVLQRRVTPSTSSRMPSRTTISAPRSSPTRISAPKIVRPSSAGSRSVRPASSSRPRGGTTSRRRP